MARVLAGVLIGAALLGAVASSGRADGVTDEISQALDAYRAGDLNGAANALDAAGTLIRQAKAAKLKAYLPEPLPGWTAKDAESAAVGSAMFGGGTTVTRRYTKGNSSVEVSIITDSPMMSAPASMFSGGFLVTDEVQPLVVDGHQMI